MTQNELLRAWVDALESGKYQQAQKTLRTKDGFCCLGVACDVSGTGEWRPIEDVAAYWMDEHGRQYEPECKESTHCYRADRSPGDELGMPDLLREKFGLTSEQENALQTLNDDMGATFAGIAQTIRAWFPAAFVTVDV